MALNIDQPGKGAPTSNPNNTAGSSAAHSLVAVEGGLFSQTSPDKQGINTSTSNTTGIEQNFPTPDPLLLDLSSSYHTSLAQLNPLVQQQLQHGHGVLNIPTSPLYSQQTQQRVNTPYAHQPQGYLNLRGAQGYPNNTVASGSYAARMPVSVERGSLSSQTTTSNPLRSNYSSQRTLDQEWNSENQPPYLTRDGRSPRDVQKPYQLLHGLPTGGLDNSAQSSATSGGRITRSFTYSTGCKMPGCTRPCFIHSRSQERLDYCELHLGTAIGRGYAAACKRCRSLPVLGMSDYCSLFCSNADREMVYQESGVSSGFAPACLECRGAITENTGIYHGSFCSKECWNAHHTHSSRHF
ncbi:hypothetical protein BJV77DRAFT_1160455 [Russula vinacea]|nr:hypothetical protein BJV77DRAFT_1160455 [Russula vinacea]